MGYCPTFHLERHSKTCPRYNQGSCDNTVQPCDVDLQIQTRHLTERQRVELRKQISEPWLDNYATKLKEKYSDILAQSQPKCTDKGEMYNELKEQFMINSMRTGVQRGA